jgi:hypothetical protein
MKLRKALSGIAAIILLSSCVSESPVPSTETPTPSPTPPPTATPLSEGLVIINNSPGQLIGGNLYGHGETAVILASRGGYSRGEWSQYARILADEGYTALTISSQDSEGITVTHVRYAILFLRNNGFKHILCAGASNGASGCAFNAKEPEIEGIVLITYHGIADLSKSTLPKLFLGAELDTIYRPISEREYEKAAEPKKIIIVPGSAETGPSLLETPGQNLREQFLEFLRTSAGR